MKKLFLASFFALLSLCANAYDFEVDGIYYNITDDNNAEVTVNGYGTYTDNIVIPNKVSYDSKEYSVTSIERDAFRYCCMKAIDIPEGVTSIGDGAFYDCHFLESINIPESVTSIGELAFADCQHLTAINIPEGVTRIRQSVFSGCINLTSIEIPESVTSIGNYAFSYCAGLTSIKIPEGVTSIGKEAFSYCAGLTSIVVASGNSVYDSRNNCNAIINTIDNSLVSGCKNTVIPEGVTSIGDYAFYGCSSLADIYCYASTPAGTVSDTFSQNTYNGCTLHVPYGTMNAYRAAANWKKFVNIVEFDPTGVGAVSANGKSAAEQRIYNLGGVRMAAPQRGLNIINGKKVAY